jgi:hypothetical protein
MEHASASERAPQRATSTEQHAQVKFTVKFAVKFAVKFTVKFTIKFTVKFTVACLQRTARAAAAVRCQPTYPPILLLYYSLTYLPPLPSLPTLQHQHVPQPRCFSFLPLVHTAACTGPSHSRL